MKNDIVVHRIVKAAKRSGQYIDPHFHSFYHYIYTLEGSDRITINGTVYETSPRMMLLIPPNTIHDIRCIKDSQVFDIKFNLVGSVGEKVRELPRCIPCLTEYENSLIIELFEEALSRKDYFDELIDLRFYELLILFLRRQSRPSGNSQTITYHATSQNQTILTILNLIEEHIREPLQVADLARECSYSKSYFQSFFKKHMGINPSSYINQRKIAKAKEMIMYSSRNLTQISEELGFESIHYFSRLFKKMTGLTPSSYSARVKGDRPINIIYNEHTPKTEYEMVLHDPEEK